MNAIGKVEYEIKNGEVVYKPGGTVGVMLAESRVGEHRKNRRCMISARDSSPYTAPTTAPTVPRGSRGSPI